MNARFVLEGIRTNNSLVGLTLHARVLRHHLRGGSNVHWIDGSVESSSAGTTLEFGVALESETHDNLFERCVPGPFANPVDGAFQLTGTIQSSCQRVGRCQPQIVLTMSRKDNILGTRNILPQLLDEFTKLPWHVPARRVGDVQGGSTGLDHFAQNTVQKLRIGSSGIFGTEFDIVATEGLGECYSLDGNLYNFVGSLSEFRFHVNGRRSDKGVDPRSLSTLHCIPCTLNILDVGTRQSTNHGNVSVLKDFIPNHIRDLFDCVEIIWRCNGKPGFDNVDTKLG
mmetsp:Transcript_53/g.77  ORF Transcript_53/g.77 Transcript_53/m.77 type:complete len:283 (-) Transcript_53:198-1046(-)